MATRRVPDREAAKAARFTHQIVEHFRSDPQLAKSHAETRNGHVVKVLCWLALLRDAQNRSLPLPPRPRVTCEEAQWQHFRESHPRQAAHLLPGQIMVDGRYPWLYLNDIAHARALQLLFAEVRALPANFNKADSAAEGKGLIEAFRAAGEYVLHGRGPPRQDIIEAYRAIWVPGARAAYAAAQDQKRSRPSVPSPVYDIERNIVNLDEIEEAGRSQWDVHDQIRILVRYGASLDEAPPELRPHKMDEILGRS